ncbi:MAG: hypothetical protein EHM30_15090, partial [Desulfobacteraceae bacterium]
MNIDNEPMTAAGVRENGFVRINAEKSYVINGPVADFTAVVGIMDNKPAIFIVEKGAGGLIPGKRLDMVGFDGAAVSGLTLDNCLISEDSVIGPFDDKSV